MAIKLRDREMTKTTRRIEKAGGNKLSSWAYIKYPKTHEEN